MRKQLKQVEEFHQAFGVYANAHPTFRTPQKIHDLRMRVMQEEVNEYAKEFSEENKDDQDQFRAMAKELADIAYTLFGTVISHGLQDEFERIFDAVHVSNMSKLDASGKPIHREDGKVLKSNLYREADLSFLNETSM